jgi:hypothetical protein
VFCNLMLVFHEDLHAELLFYFRSIFLPMFKLECKQIVCWTLMRKKKQILYSFKYTQSASWKISHVNME